MDDVGELGGAEAKSLVALLKDCFDGIRSPPFIGITLVAPEVYPLKPADESPFKVRVLKFSFSLKTALVGSPSIEIKGTPVAIDQFQRNFYGILPEIDKPP